MAKPGYINDMVKLIRSLAKDYSEYIVFADWVNMAAISVRNATCVFDRCLKEDNPHRVALDRYENDYARLIAKYKGKEEPFADLTALLAKELERDPRDVLGELFMVGNFGSKLGGQFFTPKSVQELSAGLAVPSVPDDPYSLINLYEPTIGSGGMVIAMCRQLSDRNVPRWRRRLRVIAQDMDWRCIHMSYLQLSLLAIDAVIVQGDTLAEPYPAKVPDASRIWRTPANKGCLL